MEKLEFNSFLLSLSKKLGQSDFEQLKFLLEAFVPVGRSEGLKEAFKYFAELERMRMLAPTDLSILRKGFEEIGRQDLVEELDEKKDYFNQLFHSKSKDHQNGKFDVVCDGNDSNSSQTSCLSRGDLGATKAVKLMGNMKDDDLQVQEFRVDSEDGHKESKDIFLPDESANGPHIDPLFASNATLPESRIDEELRAALGSCGIKSSEGPELAQAGHKEPCKSVTYASLVYTPKQHNQADDDDVVSDCIEDEKAESKEPSGNKGEVSSEAQGHQSSPHEYGGARPKPQTLKWPVSSESTLSGPQTQTDQGHGTISSDTASGKQPIEDECSTSSPFGAIYEDGKFDVVCGGNDSNSSETSSFRADLGATKAVKLMGNMKDDDLQVQEFRVDSEDGHKESKDIFFPDESANGPHIDPLVASNATLPESRSDEELGAALGSCSIKSSEGPELAQAVHKEPFKSVTYASPVYTPKQHNQADDDDVVSDCIEDEKAESKEPSGNKGEVSSEAQGHQSSPHEYGGARPKHQTSKWPVSSESTLSGPQTQMDQGYGTISPDTASGKQPIEDECSTSSPFGAIYEDGQSTQHPTFQDDNFPTTDSSVQPRSYDKGGYSVVISNGTLRHATKERAIVMMKTRTQFQIAIANNNDFDAEVDITFGGMFLGVWLVEAKRSLQNPLIVEGSPWTKGRLTFFSASDTSAPKTKEEYYGGIPEQNGIIELEFKPEEMIPHFYVQHVKNGDNSPKEILMPNFKTATIGDLKREINKKFDSEVALLMVNGRILEEDKTISSYALQDKAIIEVLFTEEELFIESTEGDRKLMLIEPRKTSLLDVKQFIAIKIGIPVDEQRICYRGENLCDSNPPSLLHLFTKAKAPPVFKVSAVVELPKERKQRGFRASRSTGRTLRGFGGNTSCDSDESMIEFFDSRPRVSLLRGDHDYGSVNRFGEEGRAILCGDEENVFKQFQEDKRQVTFSKEKAVKMVIQLVSNSSSEPTGPRRSSEPTGPKSTRYPPPVPE